MGRCSTCATYTDRVSRAVIPSLLCVVAGLAAGLLITVYLMDVQPPVMAWLLGAGAGMSGGAFIAALATNTPLAGNPRRRPIQIDHVDDEADAFPSSPSTNGHSGAHSANGTVRRPDL